MSILFTARAGGNHMYAEELEKWLAEYKVILWGKVVRNTLVNRVEKKYTTSDGAVLTETVVIKNDIHGFPSQCGLIIFDNWLLQSSDDKLWEQHFKDLHTIAAALHYSAAIITMPARHEAYTKPFTQAGYNPVFKWMNGRSSNENVVWIKDGLFPPKK